ncbi:peptidoglycan DD-metalloendopeptidase family protein [Knoellia locipacati]|uniref:peptidoglycan DD-metalloendopeptidase family protein n=1 Tax=Knoellia locipacati TaxID=882824 RepID=UPI00384D7E7B
MKKIALGLVPLLVLLCLPLALGAMAVVGGAAVGAQLPTVDCGGAMPATGEFRPPFQQAYAVSQRGFGNEFHPIAHEWRQHTGQDLSSLPGPGPVVAIAAGKVTFAAARGGYGNLVDVTHAGGVVSRYAHLAKITVKPGQVVSPGATLGIEGSTGGSTGEHLHLEIHVGGRAVDPVPFMLERGAPLNGKAVAPSTTTRDIPSDVTEGGIGFDLPAAGAPRQDSLRTPPASIPAAIKSLYAAAAARYKIPWTLLAGIGMEETWHGRNKGNSSAGAQGLMQFMPATFATMGVDGDGDGRADIRNDADSVYSAANYLIKSGVANGPTGVKKALWAYNHADWYVNDVLHYAHAYGGGLVLGDPTDCGVGGAGNPQLPPLSSDRQTKVLTWAGSHAGDPYVYGANGPNAWDCSSFTQNAFAQVGVSMPRTAGAQRDWLAKGNGFRVQHGHERPGDIIFWDSYLGPDRIGHVVIVWDPATKTTIDARSTAKGVGHFSYADGAKRNIFEIWRVGNMADQPSMQPV